MTDCIGRIVVNINNVCYHMENLKEQSSINDISQYCKSKNLTLPDFPNQDKEFLLSFLFSISDDYGYEISEPAIFSSDALIFALGNVHGFLFFFSRI